ncbi:MAG: hypothetical protein OEX15_07640 [Gammaproteobacteria bacterium]|nr:hypothetical protein [Gammaproteobacteria bacterium]
MRGRRPTSWPGIAALGALALPCLCTPLGAHAGVAAHRVAGLAEVGYEDDADGLNAAKIRAGALLDYASELSHYGFAVQNTHYSAGGWSTDAPGVIGLYLNQRRDTLAGVRAEGGLVKVEGHTRAVGDVTWGFRPRERTGFELILAGDLVGTRQALEEGIAYGLAGASIEQQFGHRFTGVAMAGWQPFTDGNSRALFRARMIWSVLPEEGLSAQLRWRQYSSGDSDVPGAYFNPGRYRTWDAVLSVRRRIGDWRVYGLAGAGQERIENGSWQSTGVAEVRAEGPVGRDMHMVCRANYSNAAGFATSPDYWYGSVNVSLIVPFGR